MTRPSTGATSSSALGLRGEPPAGGASEDMLLDEGRRHQWQPWRKRANPMDLQGILWPSLGYPALIEAKPGELTLQVLLCISEREPLPLGQIDATLRAVPSPSGEA